MGGEGRPRREWRVAVTPNKCGQDTIESVAHWNVDFEHVLVREVIPGDDDTVEPYKQKHAALVAAAREACKNPHVSSLRRLKELVEPRSPQAPTEEEIIFSGLVSELEDLQNRHAALVEAAREVCEDAMQHSEVQGESFDSVDSRLVQAIRECVEGGES